MHDFEREKRMFLAFINNARKMMFMKFLDLRIVRKVYWVFTKEYVQRNSVSQSPIFVRNRILDSETKKWKKNKSYASLMQERKRKHLSVIEFSQLVPSFLILNASG